MRIYNPVAKLVRATRITTDAPFVLSHIDNLWFAFEVAYEKAKYQAQWIRSIESPEDYWGNQREDDAAHHFASLPVTEAVAQIRGCITTMQSDIECAERNGLPVPATRAQLERLKEQLQSLTRDHTFACPNGCCEEDAA
jgi:hypothetical protein